MSQRRADLIPQLSLDEYRARDAPAYAEVEQRLGRLGNGFLEVRVDFSKGQDATGLFTNKISQEQYKLGFSPFELWFDGAKISAAEAKLGRMEARGSADMASLSMHASFKWFDAELSYVLNRGEHFVRKLIVLRNFTKSAYLERVTMFKHLVSPNYRLFLHEGGMFYPIVFMRSKQSSVFFAVDFVGSFASVEGQSFSFDYFPGQAVEPGRHLRLLTVVMGIAGVGGRNRCNPYHESAADLDIEEQQWFRECLLRGSISPQLPYKEVKAPGPGVEGPSELETLDQCGWLDAQHVFLPKALKSIDAYPLLDIVKKRMEEQGIRAALVLSRDVTTNLRWVALAPDGTPASPDYGACFACNDFAEHLIERYLSLMDEHGFHDIEVSGSPIVPCYRAGHDHVPGPESLHQAFQGLVEVAAALRENGGHMSCSGPYGSYGAGLAQLSDSISVIAEDHPLPLPDLHVGRLFADMGRLYFRRSHSFLLPHTMLANSVGLAPESCPDAPYPGADHYPWYLYHDSAGWRYALISALATGLRHRFYALPQDLDEDDRAFARKWLKWEKDQMVRFKHVEEILEEPGLDAVDGYSYTTSRGAVVFLFNCSYDPKEVRLQLRLTHDWEYVVRAIYPQELNVLGPNDGLFRRDGSFVATLGPREARIIEVVRRSPASAKRKRPEVFGAEWVEDGDRINVFGKPGDRTEVGLRIQGRFTQHDVRFPGERWSRHIKDWVITQCRFEEGVESLVAGAFPGRRFSSQGKVCRNAWLCAKAHVPKELEERLDTSPFKLAKPGWAYPNRLFFVVRFEPESAFEPIRTSSGVTGVPESYLRALPLKYGIDLAPMNIGLRAWLNGEECVVYPALASWRGFAPNTHPIVAFFFEAGSKLKFGSRNQVVLFANNFNPAAFRGIFMDCQTELQAMKALTLP